MQLFVDRCGAESDLHRSSALSGWNHGLGHDFDGHRCHCLWYDSYSSIHSSCPVYVKLSIICLFLTQVLLTAA